MTSMFSLADFMLRSPPGGDCDWLTPPQSPSGARTPQRHDERGMETSNWPNPGTSTWPPADTFPRPRTPRVTNALDVHFLVGEVGYRSRSRMDEHDECAELLSIRQVQQTPAPRQSFHLPPPVRTCPILHLAFPPAAIPCRSRLQDQYLSVRACGHRHPRL